MPGESCTHRGPGTPSTPVSTWSGPCTSRAWEALFPLVTEEPISGRAFPKDGNHRGPLGLASPA